MTLVWLQVNLSKCTKIRKVSRFDLIVAEMWDCVVTCFFIDTAHNVIDYMICINKILKVGGLWVNLGPLLWHYADSNHEMQIELTCEEVLDLIPKCGFKIRKSEFRKCTYT